jgi:hypothetical protein
MRIAALTLTLLAVGVSGSGAHQVAAAGSPPGAEGEVTPTALSCTSPPSCVQYANEARYTTTEAGINRDLAAVRFNAVAGGKYRVSSKLALADNSRELGVLGYINCRYDSSGTSIETLTHTENMLAGDSAFTLYPRYVLAPATGAVTCKLAVLPKTHDGSGGSTGYTVRSTSWVKVGQLQPSAEDVRSTQDYVLGPGDAADVAANSNFTLSSSNATVALSGDAQLTTCHYTYDPEVSCPNTGQDNVTQTEVRLFVFQRKPGVTSGSDWCFTTQVGATESRTIVGHSVHHGPIYAGGAFTGKAGCGTSARIKMYVRNTGGGSGSDELVSVHKTTSILSIMPAAS